MVPDVRPGRGLGRRARSRERLPALDAGGRAIGGLARSGRPHRRYVATHLATGGPRITLPPEIDARLRELAGERGRSQSQVIVDALLLAVAERHRARELPTLDAELSAVGLRWGLLDTVL